MNKMRTGHCHLPRLTRRRRFPFAHGGKCAILALSLVGACDEQPVSAPTEDVAPHFGPGASLSAAYATDRAILVALFEATDGPNWVNSENWLTSAPLNEWYGVATDADGRVTGLDLSGRWDDETRSYVGHGLSGPIPAQLGGLTNLTGLDLAINNLSGPIPAELGALANLRSLRLGVNGLSGPVPPQLGDLANLEYLWLGSNDLSGPVPTELIALANLWNLSLGNNELSGRIPAELGSMANLRHLSLENNRLSGSIPVELGGLGNLSSLDLADNQLRGSIPPELGRLVNLGSLYLSDNELEGSIPAELGDLTNLRFLYLRHNALSGTVPSSFLRLSHLSAFGFDGNTGLCVPPNLVVWYEALENQDGSVCPDLEILQALYEDAGGTGWSNADGWLGDGPVEEWYGVDIDSTGLVSSLDLEGNGLSGGLPTGLGRLAGLTSLRVGDNALSGRLPVSLTSAPLRELGYANTELCVPVEGWFRDWLTTLPRHEGTSAECPQLSDREILVALYDATGGPDWMDSDNWLTDAPLGEWHGVRTDDNGRVVSLDLRFSELTGSIPVEVGGLSELETLILFRNELTGPIPPSFGDLASAKLVVLAGNRLSGPIPPELGGMTSLEQFHAHGNELASIPPELGQLDNLEVVNLSSNRLTSIPPELGGLPNLRSMGLSFNWLTSIPPELGNLPELRYLGLWANEITSIPPELGNLSNLAELDLDDNQLTSVPAELGRLDNLEVLWLASNSLQNVPPELGEMDSLAVLNLWGNRLTGMSTRPGDYPNLRILDLSSNEFASFPSELSGLGNLQQLELDGNRLTDIPPGLGSAAGATRIAPQAGESLSLSRRGRDPDRPWTLYPDGHELPADSRKREALAALQTHLGEPGGDRPADTRTRAGGFASLKILDLSSNELSGGLPAGLVEFTGLTSLSVADNDGLDGPLPFDLTFLEDLEDLHTTGTDLCAPAHPEFVDWLDGVTRQRVALCEGGGAAAYLTQAVQSREFPVPLVAGEPALLRVFLTTAGRSTGATMPPVHAAFYRDGALAYEVDIPAKPDPIPAGISEGSLARSVNAEIPGWVIEPGLEVVIEPDPHGTLDPSLGVARRIPERGRLALDVRAMPVFEVTLVPFLWEERPDSSILGITADMAADPEGHELFERTHLLLPISEIDARAHGSVTSSTNSGFGILAQTEMIRVMEGGRGHYLGVMAGPTGPGGLLGVAWEIGSWSSFSVLDAETIAHEFGHNRNLYHAPCGGAGGPDRYYPYTRGAIGAWGYDFSTGQLVPPGQPDFMSYCEPTWTSDYQFTNAVRYRLETETGSILVTAGDRANSPTRTLLLWGGLDSDGTPHLNPAFFTDAPPAPPTVGGLWSLTGWDSAGTQLFSLSFDMAEFTDSDGDHAGFSFALPATWTGELARIELRGPRGSAGLDRNTDDPLTILRDPVTGQVRGILDGDPARAAASDAGGPAAGAAGGFRVLFSRGIPVAGDPRGSR